MRGRADPGLTDLLGARVVVGEAGDGPLGGGGHRGGGHVGGVDRQVAVLLEHDDVAEVVVPVLVGIDQRREWSGSQTAYVGGDDPRLPLGAVCVDHHQPVGPADQGDVDVQPVVAGHPDTVRDLCEVGHDGHCRHG